MSEEYGIDPNFKNMRLKREKCSLNNCVVMRGLKDSEQFFRVNVFNSTLC